jgi:hypothetical protein
VRGYRPRRIDEVPPFRLELKVIGFGGVTELPRLLARITSMSRRRWTIDGMPRKRCGATPHAEAGSEG